jgi:glutamate---cysteine ligase / carboxylate-amine ligase
LVVDPVTRTPRPAGPQVAARAASELGDSISGEFTRHQIEIKTAPCVDSGQLRAELVRLRASACAAAEAEGLRVCASGTPVLTDGGRPPVGDHPRYRAGVEQYRAMIEDFAVCSLHMHVHLPERELAVLVSNHLRPWLPLLLSISANSPFHHGEDTGYADWRAMIRSRFPCLGPPPYAESLAHHEELAVAMAQSGAMLEPNMPFWDIRPNPRLPTLEIRAADVVADVDDAVALTVLVRALVTTARDAALAGDPGPRPSTEILRAAYWRAARDGWSGCGVDALSGQLLPAPVQASRLADHVGPALDHHGDGDIVRDFLRRLETRGTGADLQRASAVRHGALTGVVDDLIALTAQK